MKWGDREVRNGELDPEFEFKSPDSSSLPPEVLPKEWKPEVGDEENGFPALLAV